MITKAKALKIRALAMESAAAECIDAVTVVTQYDVIEQMAGDMGFACVRNDHPEWGASYTVRLGTAALQDCDAILYMVSDQPFLQRSSVEQIVDLWRQNPSCIVGAAHKGVRGNPDLFPRDLFPALLALEGDRGGGGIIRANEDRLLLVEIHKNELSDVDTKAALEAMGTE